MRGFNFSLDRVLRFREHCQVAARQELKVVTQQLYDAEAVLWEMRGKFKDGHDSMFASGAVITGSKAKKTNEYLFFLKQDIDRHENEVHHLRQLVEEKREKLVEAKKKSTILEKMKEKAYSEYLVEQGRVEQSMLDEIGQRQSASTPVGRS